MICSKRLRNSETPLLKSQKREMWVFLKDRKRNAVDLVFGRLELIIDLRSHRRRSLQRAVIVHDKAI